MFFNRFFSDYNDSGSDSDNPDCQSKLDEAIFSNDTKAIQRLSTTKGSYKSLEYAVQKQQPETIKMLLKNTDAHWVWDERRRWSALHEAVSNEYVEGVDLLLSHRYWKNAIDGVTREEQESALHIAMKQENTEIINKLVKKGANISLYSLESNLTPLQMACKKGMLDVVKTMLGKKVFSDPDAHSFYVDVFEKTTELVCAAENGHLEIVKLLIEHGGYDINDYEVVKEYTPLHKASENGYHEIVELLLKNKASCKLKNKDGHSARQLAVFKNHEKVLKVFEEYMIAEDSIDSNESSSSSDEEDDSEDEDNEEEKLSQILSNEKLEDKMEYQNNEEVGEKADDNITDRNRGIKRKNSSQI